MIIFIRKYRTAIGIMIAALFFGTGLYLISSRIFVIRKIVVANPQVSVIIDENVLNRHLLFLPGDLLRRELLAEYPQFKDVIIKKKYPDTLIIDFVTREGVAYVKAGTEMLFTDELGKVIGPAIAHPGTYPVVDLSFAARWEDGTAEEALLISVLTFIRTWGTDAQLRYIIRENERSFRVRLGDSDIIISQNSNIFAAVSTLQMLMARFRMKGRLPVVIDLRYEKPVVRY